jgi:hypothetical protein
MLKLFCNVEVVVGGVRQTDFLIDLIDIATRGWRLAALSVDALDRFRATECRRLDDWKHKQKPRNGFGVA